MFDLINNLKLYTFVRTEYMRRDASDTPPVCDNIDTHYHDFYQLVYIRQGTGWIFAEGKFLEPSAGDVLIINRNTPHTFVPSSVGLKTLELKFSFEDAAPDFIFSKLPYLSCRDNDNIVKDALRRIEAEVNNNLPLNREIIALEVFKILLFLQRACLDNNDSDDKSENVIDNFCKDVFFSDISDFIDNNLEEIDIKLLSKHFHMEYSYLSHYFRKKYNMKLSSLISSKRLICAKKLLVDSELTMTEIAVKCGFKTIHRLDSVFKRELGMSPTKYRQRHKLKCHIDIDAPELISFNGVSPVIKKP